MARGRKAQPKPHDPYGLGQWVTFKWVVSRFNGFAHRQSMGRIRKGMIIGHRNVYDCLATEEGPPVLGNARPVIIVAVSVHRCYKVFKEDIILEEGEPCGE